MSSIKELRKKNKVKFSPVAIDEFPGEGSDDEDFGGDFGAGIEMSERVRPPKKQQAKKKANRGKIGKRVYSAVDSDDDDDVDEDDPDALYNQDRELDIEKELGLDESTIYADEDTPAFIIKTKAVYQRHPCLVISGVICFGLVAMISLMFLVYLNASYVSDALPTEKGGKDPEVSTPKPIDHTKNHLPTIEIVRIRGTPHVGSKLVAYYDYADQDDDAEGSTRVIWQFSLSNSNVNMTTIVSSDRDHSIIIPPEAAHGIIYLQVIPHDGIANGIPQLADPVQVLNSPPSVARDTIGVELGCPPNVVPMWHVAGDDAVHYPHGGWSVVPKYEYHDVDNDPEGDSKFLWQSALTHDGEVTWSDLALTKNDDGSTCLPYREPSLPAAFRAPVVPVDSLGAVGMAVFGPTIPVDLWTSFYVADKQPVITGIVQVGNQIEVDLPYARTVGGRLLIQWQVSEVEATSDHSGEYEFADINGEFSVKLLVTHQMSNRQLRVAVALVPAVNSTSSEGPLEYSALPLELRHAYAQVAVTYSRAVTVSRSPPTARKVEIHGIPDLHNSLFASYQYWDSDRDAEGITEFRWKYSEEAGGPYYNVFGADDKLAQSLVLTPGSKIAAGVYVMVEVTPVSLAKGDDPDDKTLRGTPTKSEHVQVRLEKLYILESGMHAVDLGLVQLGQNVDASLPDGSVHDPQGGKVNSPVSYEWFTSDVASNDAGGWQSVQAASQSPRIYVAQAFAHKFLRCKLTPQTVAREGVSAWTRPEQVKNIPAEATEIDVSTVLSPSGGSGVDSWREGKYKYTDPEGDVEGRSIVRWLASSGPDVNGTVSWTEVQHHGDSSLLPITRDVAHKYLRFSVGVSDGWDETPTATFKPAVSVAVGHGSQKDLSEDELGEVVPNTVPVVTSPTLKRNHNYEVPVIAKFVRKAAVCHFDFFDADGDQDKTMTYWRVGQAACPPKDEMLKDGIPTELSYLDIGTYSAETYIRAAIYPDDGYMLAGSSVPKYTPCYKIVNNGDSDADFALVPEDGTKSANEDDVSDPTLVLTCAENPDCTGAVAGESLAVQGVADLNPAWNITWWWQPTGRPQEWIAVPWAVGTFLTPGVPFTGGGTVVVMLCTSSAAAILGPQVHGRFQTSADRCYSSNELILNELTAGEELLDGTTVQVHVVDSADTQPSGPISSPHVGQRALMKASKHFEDIEWSQLAITWMQCPLSTVSYETFNSTVSAECSAIPGANQTSYTLQDVDVGYAVSVSLSVRAAVGSPPKVAILAHAVRPLCQQGGSTKIVVNGTLPLISYEKMKPYVCNSYACHPSVLAECAACTVRACGSNHKATCRLRPADAPDAEAVHTKIEAPSLHCEESCDSWKEKDVTCCAAKADPTTCVSKCTHAETFALYQEHRLEFSNEFTKATLSELQCDVTVADGDSGRGFSEDVVISVRSKSDGNWTSWSLGYHAGTDIGVSTLKKMTWTTSVLQVKAVLRNLTGFDSQSTSPTLVSCTVQQQIGSCESA